MKNLDFSARLRHIRESFGLGQTEFAQNLGIPRTSLINYEKGVSSPSLEFLALLKFKYAVDIDWFLTGEGAPFLNAGVGAAPAGEGDAALAEGEGGEAVRHFEIPLLTKKEAELYNPAKEIPFGKIKANSGDYPDISTVPIPWRALEYSTDLRAIEVFDSRMFPVFKSGDIVVFEATGWNGNGIYLYRMSGGLHISYAGRLEEGFVLLNEIDKPIVYDAATFVPLGRVRAVVKDMLGADWKGGAMPPSGG